jgi:hypothetical protein
MTAQTEDTYVQRAQDHSEEEYSMRQEVRQEIIGQRLNFAKAMDMLMLSRVAVGAADLVPAQTAAYNAALEAVGLTDMMKNASAFPFAVDKTSKVEYGSQTLSEDTTQNVLDKVLRQVGETMTQEISRVVMDGLNTLASALRAEIAAQEED